MAEIVLRDFSWERVIEAVEAVQDRLLRATRALEDSGVPYAVIGGTAVALWVARVDRSAVRNTQDVDLTIRRGDLERAKNALASAGFIYRHVKGIDMFLDGPDAKVRDAVHVIFAGEKVRPEDIAPAPDVTESEQAESYRVLKLDALARMKLTSFRRKDQLHLSDMLDIGLIDASWLDRFPPELAARLKELIDNPEESLG